MTGAEDQGEVQLGKGLSGDFPGRLLIDRRLGVRHWLVIGDVELGQAMGVGLRLSA